jgi:hypothetical protein
VIGLIDQTCHRPLRKALGSSHRRR